MQYKYIIIMFIIHYKGSDNRNNKTGYGNGTNVNLYFSDTVYRFAVYYKFKI